MRGMLGSRVECGGVDDAAAVWTCPRLRVPCVFFGTRRVTFMSGGSIFSRLLLKCANELHEKFSVFSRKENTENLKT